MKRLLLLTDGKAGHENQAKAFARALGLEFDVVPMAFKSKGCKALSYMLDRLGISTLRLFRPGCVAAALSRRDVAGVVGAGSGVFYAAKAVAKALGAKCGVVLYPRGYDVSGFDCILAPSFDRPRRAANVVEIPANLVAADAAFYESAVAAFREHFERNAGRVLADAGNAVAVIVGGPNKCSSMSAEWAKERLEEVFADNPGASFWVTTSRRTPPEVEAVVDAMPWEYKLLYSRDHFNPVPAFVALAKRVYVTAESTGMLSEACTFGKGEVRALDNLLPGRHKFRRFLDSLRGEGYVDGSRKIDLSEQFASARRLMGL